MTELLQIFGSKISQKYSLNWKILFLIGVMVIAPFSQGVSANPLEKLPFWPKQNTSDKVKLGPGYFGNWSQKGKIAVITFHGGIYDSEIFLEAWNTAQTDENVYAIVLHISSPGGSFYHSIKMHDAIKNSRKPVVAYVEQMAASGAYLAASPATAIITEGPATLGSIGAYRVLEKITDLKVSKSMKEQGGAHLFLLFLGINAKGGKEDKYDFDMDMQVIRSGTFKALGMQFDKDLTNEQKQHMQKEVDHLVEIFRNRVMENREMSPEEFDLVSEGRVFLGYDAVELKLADKIGSFEDAIEYAASLVAIELEPIDIYELRKHRQIELIETQLEINQSHLRLPGVHVLWPEGAVQFFHSAD